MEKLQKLKEIIGAYHSAVIAFSGGVDSTFLARVARDVLGDKLLLLTATSSSYPFHELEEAKKFAAQMGVAQRVIVSEEIDIPGYSDNPPDRCYYCKSELFTLVKHIAEKDNYEAVFDGSNADDTGDFRPGMRAAKELGVISPLKLAGLTKNDIRTYSREYNLPTADKPSYACLASRFPYGIKITTEKLERVGRAEVYVRRLGFTQFRVRDHDGLARLEFAPGEMDKAWDLRAHIKKICKDAGYTYVSIDVEGYRTGAMNEVLTAEARVAQLEKPQAPA
ncbi:MAG: ATP-dependent sacrificial sulfur transferase LarE [Chitinivibrionales bacterium]|nr:ATP-dependent sacrificial sulfur transferase LarE [Chitinivibrionales bacterium]